MPVYALVTTGVATYLDSVAVGDRETLERMRRVRILLATRFDYVDRATQAIRIAQTDAVDGPAESRYVPCECHQTIANCGNCGGKGLRRKRVGDEGWDEYVEAPLRDARAPRLSSGTLDLRADIARLDAELAKLKRDELARQDLIAKHDDEAWVRAFDSQARQGSYRELGRALARLEDVCPRLRWAVKVVYESQLEIDAPRALALEPLAVTYLSKTMRGSVRIPKVYEEEAAEDRRRSIEELLALGWKTSRVARTLGVSAQKVKSVAKRLAA